MTRHRCVRLLTLAVALALALVLAPLRARAEEEEVARARAHYEIGLGLYQLGNYHEAIKEFSAGYQLSRRPQFLINLGQAHRRLHELDRATEMFRLYLAQAPPGDPERKQVEELLAEVTAEAGTASSPPASAGSPVPELAPSTPERSRVSVEGRARPPSRLRRYWWTIPLAVAVAAAVGVGLGVGLAERPAAQVPCASADIGCFDLRR
jgi:tetratricopeptide (TPR) repeat protein